MTTRAEGTGLGLPIVAKILEDHGGGIELLDAASEYHGRSGAPVFSRSTSAGCGKPKASDTPAQKIERGISMASDILIVDDEADIREIVSGIL